MPVKQTARVALKIAHSGTQIVAMGRVVNCVRDQSSRGLGIEFTEIDANDKKRLQACLSWRQPRHYRPFPVRECLDQEARATIIGLISQPATFRGSLDLSVPSR